MSEKPRIRIPARRRSSPGWTKAEALAVASAMGSYVSGSYQGARSDRASMQNWSAYAASADADLLGDLETLRARSRDLGRNDPLASGALSTAVTNVVGTGLWPCAAVDAEVLGISEEEAEAVSRRAEAIFNIWASSTFCDVTRATNFAGLQRIVYRSKLESGDIFALRRQKPRPGAIVGLTVQLIEADRARNPVGQPEVEGFSAGIRRDRDGEPIEAHFTSRHPGDTLSFSAEMLASTAVPFFGQETGEPILLHIRDKMRDGQGRGVPFLAPVIEPLKQLGRYSDSELMAAVVSSFFTVFVKSPSGGSLGDLEQQGMTPGAGDIALGPGAVVDLAQGEDVTFANPGRPSPQFDPFWLAMVRQIGVALEIPYELLIKHFSSSYSASRAALETAWQAFRTWRVWLTEAFCQPVYEWFFAEAVARGLIDAPGFFEDPIKRAAWCAATWVGDARLSLDPVKDAKADEIAEAHGWKTAEEITAERTGGDWRRKQERRKREVKVRREAGLELPLEPPAAAASAVAAALEDAALTGPAEGDTE